MIWHHGLPLGDEGSTNSTPSCAAFTSRKKLSSITHSPSSLETCSVCPLSIKPMARVHSEFHASSENSLPSLLNHVMSRITRSNSDRKSTRLNSSHLGISY